MVIRAAKKYFGRRECLCRKQGDSAAYPGDVSKKNPIKIAVFFGVIKGRRKFFWGRGGHAVVRRFSVVWGDACKERSCIRCQTFPPLSVNGVGVVKCGERLAFRRFPPRCVSASVKCKYVFFHPAFSAAEQNNRQVPDGKGRGVRSLFSLTTPFCLTRF